MIVRLHEQFEIQAGTITDQTDSQWSANSVIVSSEWAETETVPLGWNDRHSIENVCPIRERSVSCAAFQDLMLGSVFGSQNHLSIRGIWACIVSFGMDGYIQTVLSSVLVRFRSKDRPIHLAGRCVSRWRSRPAPVKSEIRGEEYLHRATGSVIVSLISARLYSASCSPTRILSRRFVLVCNFPICR